MSKIQKALGALKSSDEQKPKRVAPQTPGHNRYQVSENAAAAEVIPKFAISVDLDLLRANGLHPKEEHSELINQQFRRIKRPVLNIAFNSELPSSENPNVIMMTSALPKSGKSFCTMSLAISIARERDVGAIVVDADVLRPFISRSLHLEKRPGLIDYLVNPNITLDDILVATNLFGITVVPAGSQHEEATELLASSRMKRFVRELAERYPARAIVVDTPPLLLTNEANVLAENMGQIVFIIEAGVSTQDAVIEATGLLSADKPVNAILNKFRGIEFGGGYSENQYGFYGTEGYEYEQEER
jgi:protein-tyrosine kinase